jgi:hypothetical protein
MCGKSADRTFTRCMRWPSQGRRAPAFHSHEKQRRHGAGGGTASARCSASGAVRPATSMPLAGGRARSLRSCFAIAWHTSPAGCRASSPATSTRPPTPHPTRYSSRSGNHQRRRSTTFSTPPIRSPPTTKERSISSPAELADGAWTGFSPVRISRPSMQRSTTPAGPAVTHRITFPSPRRYEAPPPQPTRRE